MLAEVPGPEPVSISTASHNTADHQAVCDSEKPSEQLQDSSTQPSCARIAEPLNTCADMDDLTKESASQVPKDDCALGKVQSILLTHFIGQDKALADLAVEAFIAFIRHYNEHLASYILNTSALDWPSLVRGFLLLRLPKMPELSGSGKMTTAGVHVNRTQTADKKPSAMQEIGQAGDKRLSKEDAVGRREQLFAIVRSFRRRVGAESGVHQIPYKLASQQQRQEQLMQQRQQRQAEATEQRQNTRQKGNNYGRPSSKDDQRGKNKSAKRVHDEDELLELANDYKEYLQAKRKRAK